MEQLATQSWVSGRAGRAIVRRGSEYFVMDVGVEPLPCTVGDLIALITLAPDVIRVETKGDLFEGARMALSDAWRKDRALASLLMALDSDLSFPLRKEAGANAAELMADEAVREYVTDQLLKWPIPSQVDVGRAPLAGDLKALVVARRGGGVVRVKAEHPPSVVLVGVAEGVKRILEGEDYLVTVARNAEEALGLAAGRSVPVVVTNVRLPGMTGLDLLSALKESRAQAEVIILSAKPSVTEAIDALRRGATDYLTKPVTAEALIRAVSRAWSAAVREPSPLQTDIAEGLEALVGTSDAVNRIREIVSRVSASSASILLVGERGTGKAHLARIIHQLSAAPTSPFVSINLAALPEVLAESALFGHVKGAFTGAHASKPGAFESANGGTLLLDEIDAATVGLQAALLRVLQEKRILRVGDAISVGVNTRVIAATSQDLERSVREGRFREDLLFRLSIVPIRVPPLRERREDIPLLAEHFLRRLAIGHPLKISPAAMSEFIRHTWPGNVVELENVIERAVILDTDGVIDVDDIAQWFEHSRPSLEDLERSYILAILAESKGNARHATRELARRTATFARAMRELRRRLQ